MSGQILLVTPTLDNGRIICLMGLESMFGKTVTFTRVNGACLYETVKDAITLRLATPTSASMFLAKLMAMDSIGGSTVIFSQDNFIMV